MRLHSQQTTTSNQQQLTASKFQIDCLLKLPGPLSLQYNRHFSILQAQFSLIMLEGFELWVPPVPPEFDDGMPYYEVIGTDAQIVQFPLRRGRQMFCFSGAMCYMSDGIKMDAQLAGFGKTFGRLAGGGSLFQLTYTNESGDDNAYIACTPDYPGVIVPLNMSATGKIICIRDSFLCATVGLGREMTNVSAGFNPARGPVAFCCR
jgi:hypothetical protein